MLTTNQKGAIAEVAITKAAVELGVEVYRPAIEGGRYDMIFDRDESLVRIQCKWAPLTREVITIRCYSSRLAASGLVRRKYLPGEIDATAAYCAQLDTCYFVPMKYVRGPETHLRAGATRNHQRRRVNWASNYEFGARLAELLGP